MKRLMALMALALLPAAAADLSGTWNIDLDIAGMQFKVVWELKHEGNELSGTVKMGSDETRPVKGAVNGEAVKVEYDTVYEGQTYHLVYTGKLDGDSAMKGETDAGAAAGTFSGKKAPKP